MMRRCGRWWPAALASILITGLSQVVCAQLGGEQGAAPAVAPDSPIWLAIGPVTVEQGKEIGGLVAIGPVTVAGAVRGDVTSFGGKIVLEKTAVVHGNVTAVCAPVEKAEGAKVAGEINANALTEMGVTELGATDPAALALMIGAAEINGKQRRGLVVLGGDVRVCTGAEVADVLVIGGRLQVEEGAKVGSAKACGGEILRADGKQEASDEVIEPFVVPCSRTSPTWLGPQVGEPAGGWVGADLDHTTRSMRLGMNCGGWWNAGASLWAATPGWQLVFSLRTAAAEREPMPEDGKPARTPGARGTEWPWYPIYVSRDREPLFQTSIAVGAGVYVNTSVVEGTEGDRRMVRRTIRLAVPSDAVALAREEGMGPGLGGLGGGLGGGLRGGGGLGGGRGGGGRY